MRILQIISGTELNGAVRYGLMVSRLLAEHGHRVWVLHRPRFNVGSLPDVDGRIEYVTSTLRRTPSELARVGRMCREEGIDVLHTHMSTAHAFGALLRIFYGVRAVATAHKLNIQLHWPFNDRVICHNKESVLFQRRWNLVARSKLRIVPAFVDERDLGGPPIDRTQTRREFGIPESALLLTTVGHLIPRKGVIDIVSALPSVVAPHPTLRLAIAGWAFDEAYEAQVQARAAELNVSHHLIWLRRLPDADILRLLQASDCYVQASHIETGPLVVLEAMGLGLPVVGTQCGSMPEFIERGVTGEIAEPAAPFELGRAINNVLADEHHRIAMGHAGRDRFLKRFSAAANYPKIEAILEEAAERRKDK